MFIFDLFEKKKQDAAAGRFVGGTSQDARVKNALDNAYRAVPAAKSPEEAALGYIDIQNSLNQKQDQVLSQQNKTNQQQTQQINALVADMRRKEKDFRDLNAQVASMPNVTPQQVAKMAQDIEAAHDAGKDQAVDVPGVIAKQTTAQPTSQPAKTVAAPGPGASIAQIANFQQSQDQGAATAKTQPAAPQAKPAPTTSQAIGQMATQLTGEPPALRALPSQVVKGKNNWAANQPTIEPKPTTGTGKVKTFVNPADAQTIQSILPVGQAVNSESMTEAQLKWAVPRGSSAEEISKANLSNIVLGALAPDHPPVRMYFTDGNGPTLPWNQVAALYNYLAVISKNKTAGTEADVQNMLSDSRYFYQVMLSNIVGQTPTDPVPQRQPVNDEPKQPELFEGDVVPMTDNQTTNQAYADALTFLKRVYANPNDPMITTMRQDFAHKYQQRFQISQHPDPDRSYYLLDKQLSKKYKLPTPDFRGLEEEPYDGKSDWSDGKGQWSSENNLISSGNNPMGFSEGTNDIKKQMSKLEALALSANRAGDDAKCKRYQEKIQSLKQKLSQSMSEGLRSGEYHIHTVYFKDGTKKRIRVTSDEFDVADYYTKRGQAVDRVDYDYQIHSDMTEGDSGAKYKIKSIGKDKNGDYYISPSTGKKVYKSGVKRGDHENPKTGEHKGVAEAIPVIRGTQPTGTQYANQLAKIAMKLAKQRHADGLRNDAKDFNKAAKLFAAGDVDAGAEIIAYEMDTEPADEFYAYMEHYKIPTEIVFGLNESQTDYSKRRQRERDVDAGKPVSRQPKNPQTDYAKKRAKEKRDMELGEGTINYWTKLQNERNTKIASLVDELKESIEK